MDEMMLQFVNTLAAACGAAAPNMRHYREDRFHSINESLYWFNLTIKSISNPSTLPSEVKIHNQNTSIA